MNITALIFAVKKAWATMNSVFTVLSLFAVPAIVTTPVVWLLQSNEAPRFSSSASSKTSAQARVSGELVFPQEPLRVVYHLELLDDAGKAIMNYPEKETRGSPSFDNVILSVPESLRPGEYRLVARVRYALNPIKGGSSTVQVASILVN